MELTVQHRFAAPLELVVETLASPEYAAHLAREHSFFEHIELIDHADAAEGWQRRMRYRARPFIARLGLFSLPESWFAWTEHAQYERGVLRFDNVPTLAGVRDKVVNRGQMAFRERSDERGNLYTLREARFEVDFRVAAMYRPLKDMALAMVRRQLESSLDEEACLLADWLARADAVVAA